MNHLQLPHILTFIRANKWTFAKTMPQWPHEYVVKGELSPENQKLFEQFAVYIRKHGRDERFLGVHSVRQYLYIEGWKYWTMGAPIPETTIINRARVEPEPYDLINYDALFTADEDLEEERELLMRVGGIVGGFAGKRILDVGCGTGMFVSHVKPEPSLYTGWDPSAAMLKTFIRKHPAYTPCLFINRAQDVRPDDNEEYDLVLGLYGVGSYLPDEFFKHPLKRLMTDKGVVLFMFFHEDYFPVTHSKSLGVKFTHKKRPEDRLLDWFPAVRRWKNYYLCSNVRL